MRKFTCDCCKNKFICERTEKETLEEKNRLFGDMPLSEMVRVCDDCFKKIMEFNNHKGF